VHTRFLPRSWLARLVRQNHMLHHLKHEDYWLSFICPLLDSVAGTAPHPAEVETSDLAKRAAGRK